MHKFKHLAEEQEDKHSLQSRGTLNFNTTFKNTSIVPFNRVNLRHQTIDNLFLFIGLSSLIQWKADGNPAKGRSLTSLTGLEVTR